MERKFKSKKCVIFSVQNIFVVIFISFIICAEDVKLYTSLSNTATSIYKFGLGVWVFVCLFICLYPIIAKTA